MKKNFSKLQIVRHLVQLIMLFVLPGLYITTFNGLKILYQMIIKGNFNFIKVFSSTAEFFAVILVTIIFGRFFCGWFCVFGAYNDLIHEISKNIFKIKFKVNEKLDAILKYLKYIIMFSIIIFIWTMGSSVFKSSSPWDAFGQITDIKYVITNFTIGFIFLVFITLGAMFVERFFCRYLCPLGALFTITSKLSILNINMPKSKCNKCRVCTGNCSMGIPLYKNNKVRGGECINCLKCIEVCPRKNANTHILNNSVMSYLVCSIAIAVFIAVYGINRMSSNILVSSGISQNANVSSGSLKSNYNDGTYTGSGSGFRGGTTKVSVTISNGKISNINTLSYGDTPDFYERAESVVMNEIIKSQSTSVDVVSGATFSSRGIINSVANALSQAE